MYVIYIVNYNVFYLDFSTQYLFKLYVFLESSELNSLHLKSSRELSTKVNTWYKEIVNILIWIYESVLYIQGILVPKLTLGPLLTLSVSNGPNLQSFLFQEYISLNPKRVEQNLTIYILIKNDWNYILKQ